MANPSKGKGTREETRVVRYLRDVTGDRRIERRALHGSKDMGDVRGIYAHGYEGVAEVKAHRHRTASMVAKWRGETTDERGNADAEFAALVVKVPNRPVGECRVHLTVRDMMRSCYGMDFDCADELDEAWVTMTLAEWAGLIGGDPA